MNRSIKFRDFNFRALFLFRVLIFAILISKTQKSRNLVRTKFSKNKVAVISGSLLSHSYIQQLRNQLVPIITGFKFGKVIQNFTLLFHIMIGLFLNECRT